ncbi:hypothetical protein ABVT39_012486 [Epinephelus coioides]
MLRVAADSQRSRCAHLLKPDLWSCGIPTTYLRRCRDAVVNPSNFSVTPFRHSAIHRQSDLDLSSSNSSCFWDDSVRQRNAGVFQEQKKLQSTAIREKNSPNMPLRTAGGLEFIPDNPPQFRKWNERDSGKCGIMDGLPRGKIVSQ